MIRGTASSGSRASGVGRVVMPAAVLRYLRLTALAVLAFVCVGCTKPAPRSTNYGGPVEAVFTTGAVKRFAVTTETATSWRADRTPAVDLDAVDTLDDDDIDGERELHSRSAGHSTAGWGAPRVGGVGANALRSEIARDPSCFASGTGLPRGPPALRA